MKNWKTFSFINPTTGKFYFDWSKRKLKRELISFRAFAADFAEEEKDRERKEAEAKDLENTKQFKEAFERIKRVVASDSSLDKIVADFIKVEDQNFALFNYVTEMNNQVEGLQESIGKLRTDIKEAKGRGDERERQQREQLQNMERRVALSIREADTAEAKLDLMEGVINKLKVSKNCNNFEFF